MAYVSAFLRFQKGKVHFSHNPYFCFDLGFEVYFDTPHIRLQCNIKVIWNPDTDHKHTLLLEKRKKMFFLKWILQYSENSWQNLKNNLLELVYVSTSKFHWRINHRNVCIVKIGNAVQFFFFFDWIWCIKESAGKGANGELTSCLSFGCVILLNILKVFWRFVVIRDLFYSGI